MVHVGVAHWLSSMSRGSGGRRSSTRWVTGPSIIMGTSVKGLAGLPTLELHYGNKLIATRRTGETERERRAKEQYAEGLGRRASCGGRNHVQLVGRPGLEAWRLADGRAVKWQTGREPSGEKQSSAGGRVWVSGWEEGGRRGGKRWGAGMALEVGMLTLQALWRQRRDAGCGA